MEVKLDRLGEMVLSYGDSSAIKSFNKLCKSDLYSFEFFELSYDLASFFRQANQDSLQFEFVQIIVLNKEKYPKPDQWSRIGSKSYFLLGNFYEKVNDFDLAIKNFVISAEEYERAYGANNFNIPMVYYKIARLYRAKYQYEEAIQYYKKNIELLEERGTYKEARLLQLISSCFIEIKEYEIAHRYIDEALEIHKSDNFLNEPELAKIYNTFGVIHECKAEWESALFFYNTAKKLNLNVEGPESLVVAFSNHSIGNIYFAIPKYDSAMIFYKESLAVRERLLPKLNLNLTYSYFNVGNTYSKLGFLDSALLYCDKSIVSNLGELIDSTINIGDHNSYPISIKDLIISLTDKSEYYFLLYLQNGRDQSDIKSAFNTVNLAIEYSNHIINEISNYYSDLSWIQFEERLLDLVTIIYHHYDQTQDSRLNLSLLSSDIKKSRIHNKYSKLFIDLKDKSDFANKESFMYSRLLLNQLLLEKGIGQKEEDFNVRKIFSRESLSPNDGKYIYQTDSLLQNIQSNLLPSQTVVDYLVCDSILITNVISKDTIFKVVKSIPDLEKNVAFFLSDIKKLNSVDSSSQKLNEYLLQPIMKYIKTENLIIIPDEYLFKVPFEAIKTGHLSHSEYLINSFVISYGYSLNNLLRDNKSLKSEDFKYVYTGWTPYTEEYEDIVLTSFKDTLYQYEYLPEVYNEISTISQNFEMSGDKSRIFFGSDASLENLLEFKSSSEIVHFATHNIVDYDNPVLSHLLLSFDPNSPDRFKNILFLPIVPYLGIKANLVILDGCETGNGKLMASEGLLSMAHAISSNEVDNVVFSLWNISDLVAKKFMTSFIFQYKNGKEVDAALQEVKQEFINSSFNHPYFWAGVMGYNNYIYDK